MSSGNIPLFNPNQTLPVSQYRPVNPGRQSQVKFVPLSVQLPEMHGLGSHQDESEIVEPFPKLTTGRPFSAYVMHLVGFERRFFDDS